MKKYFQAPWSFREALLILAITTALITLAISLSNIFHFSNQYETSEYRILYILGIFIIQWILILGPLFIVTAQNHKNQFKNYGIKCIGALKTLEFIISGYLKFIGIILVLSILVLYFNLKIPGFQAQENIIPIFGEDTLSIILAGVIAVVVAPILEEVFFRGFLLRAISNKWGTVIGSVFTALVFAIFHMQWQSIIPIFILGIIINSITIRSKSIVPSIAFHIFNNAIAFTVSIFIIKDIIPIENLAT